MSSSRLKTFGGALIVGGTAIGAGMLSLPVATATAGFFPTVALYFLCWLFSAATGLLLLEICLWMPNEANIISMTRHLLGPFGKIAAWLLYLFLFYCLTIAYTLKGGEFFSLVLGGFLPRVVGIALFTVLFGAVVYLGPNAVNRTNALLMVGLAASYVLFAALGFGEMKSALLKRANWPSVTLGLPIIFASFSFQGVIPSLTSYFERNPKPVRFAIIVGSSLPFIAYTIWQLLIIGIVPLEGKHGLAEALTQGQTAIEPLRFLLPTSPIYWIGQFFAMFALTTSFLGVTLGLLDFLSDGLQIPKKGLSKIFLCAVIYIPAALIAALHPSIFIKALEYAGGIGCALLLGLLPIAMVWMGRYIKQYSSLQCQLRGGKVVLILLALFVFFEVALELIKEFIF